MSDLYSQLKGLVVDHVDPDQMVAMYTMGRLAQKTYGAWDMPEPEWLEKNLKQIEAQVVKMKAEAKEEAKQKADETKKDEGKRERANQKREGE